MDFKNKNIQNNKNMKQQLNETKRMQQLAGIIKEARNMEEMHGEEDFMAPVINYITKKYSSLITNKDYDALGAAIEKDFPSLRSDLVLQTIFGNDTPEELSTPPSGFF
jgi:uncharacterized membrane protein YheB (UPF0754 family)